MVTSEELLKPMKQLLHPKKIDRLTTAGEQKDPQRETSLQNIE